MRKPIYSVVCLFACLLAACGGGSSGSNSFANTSQLTTSISTSSSSSTSAAESSAVSSSILSVQSTSSSSSSSSLSSSSSSSISAGGVRETLSFYPDVGSSITEPLLQVTAAPKHVQKNESFTLRWAAVSNDGEIKKLSWSQVSGPAVTLTENGNQINITAGDVGEVVLEASAADTNGKSVTKKITFTVDQPFSTKAKLLQGNSNGQGIDLVIVGDGFLADDQEKLEASAKSAVSYMFDYDNASLKPYKPLFNIWLVESISETRVIPDNGSAGATLFGSYFNCWNIYRLLCVDGQKAMSVVAEHVPQFDQILVLVNSATYGGAGGQVATASLHPESKNIALHELGHSLVGLADEYVDEANAYDVGGEPIEVNVTANTSAIDVKWNYWFDNKNDIPGYNRNNYSFTEVGYFLGARYKSQGMWRPTYDSIMRNLNAPFGNVNREAWALTIWRYYNLPDDFLPALLPPLTIEKPLLFSVPVTIDPTYMHTTWWVNDEKITSSFAAPFLIITSTDKSVRSVKVTIEDATQYIRRDPNAVSKFQHTWSIQ